MLGLCVDVVFRDNSELRTSEIGNFASTTGCLTVGLVSALHDLPNLDSGIAPGTQSENRSPGYKNFARAGLEFVTFAKRSLLQRMKACFPLRFFPSCYCSSIIRCIIS